jgi:hypothetical protein
LHGFDPVYGGEKIPWYRYVTDGLLLAVKLPNMASMVKPVIFTFTVDGVQVVVGQVACVGLIVTVTLEVARFLTTGVVLVPVGSP